jgi:hypothetical protein
MTPLVSTIFELAPPKAMKSDDRIAIVFEGKRILMVRWSPSSELILADDFLPQNLAKIRQKAGKELFENKSGKIAQVRQRIKKSKKNVTAQTLAQQTIFVIKKQLVKDEPVTFRLMCDSLELGRWRTRAGIVDVKPYSGKRYEPTPPRLDSM